MPLSSSSVDRRIPEIPAVMGHFDLFVVGGSAFPQNPANGPTETIGMLAGWAADVIKENYVRNPDFWVLREPHRFAQVVENMAEAIKPPQSAH